MDESAERSYRVLNLEPGASRREIELAYHDLIRVWDPQRMHSPRLEKVAEEKLAEIIEAYRALIRDGLSAPDEPASEPAPAPVSMPEPDPAPPPSVPAVVPAPASTVPAPVPAPIVTVKTRFEDDDEEARKRRRRSKDLLTAAIMSLVLGLVIAGTMFLYQRFSSSKHHSSGRREAAAEPAPAQVAEADGEAASAPHRASRRDRAPAMVVPKQLETGAELMTPQGRRGVGRFRITNESGKEAVVKVATRDAPDTPLRLVYVAPGAETSITGIGTGVYIVSFSVGPVTGKPRKFAAAAGPFQFIEVDAVTGSQSDEYRIAIKPQ